MVLHKSIHTEKNLIEVVFLGVIKPFTLLVIQPNIGEGGNGSEDSLFRKSLT